MNLYIMTRGRVGKQYTLSRLPEKWRRRTYLVCPVKEVGEHLDIGVRGGILGVPHYVDNYSKKFQYILDGLPGLCMDVGQTEEKAVILDDDLVFSRRTADGRLKTVTDPEELGELFDYMEQLLETTALVGVHPRQMGHLAATPYVENGRIICMQGINRRLIGKVRVDQFPILADVVLNCTMLARGQGNKLITTFCQDHGPCQAPGGCSLYRTGDMQKAAVAYLADRFGPFVKSVERRTKDKWLANEEGVRNDYTAQWKKLYSAGVAHLLDPGKAPNPDKEGAGIPKAVE